MNKIKVPLVLSVKNSGNEIIKTSLFEIRHSHDGIIWKNVQGGVNVDNIKLWYLKNPDKVKTIRIDWNSIINDAYFKVITKAHVQPSGIMSGIPIAIVGNCVDPSQFRTNTVDIKCDVDIDGCATDIEFEIYPKETITFSLYFDDLEIGYSVNQNCFFPCIIVENNSDTEQTIDIFNKEKYHKYMGQGNVMFYNIHRGPSEWGSLYTNTSEYIYFRTQGNEKYNFLKIVNPHKNTIGIISAPGINIRPEEYIVELGNNIAIDIKITEAQPFTEFITTIPAKTKLMYSFAKIK